MKKLIFSTSILLMLGGISAVAQNAPAPAPVLQLGETVITANPLGRTLFEQVQPVSVLKGDRLRLSVQPTLGETLSGTPGVSSTYFGPAASRPIIRGLDGDRIRVLQNGSNTIDASATSVDHAVSFDPVLARSIEVVRGPATLLYGSNAIGGVVNVIDNRIPDERIDHLLGGNISGKYGSVNTERGGAFTLDGGYRGFNWTIQGYKTATDDLHIPGYARSARLRALDPLPPGEVEAYGVLPNSALRTEGLSGGASYVWDSGCFGLAYSGYHTNYGTVAEPNVTIDMEQRRWDFRGAFHDPFAHVKSIQYSFGMADYGHTEFEGAEVGTVFKNQGYDGRIELKHKQLGPLEGAVGYQTERSRFSALGAEAFLPPVETLANSLFIFEEVAFGRNRLQFGMRYDHINADASANPNFGPARSRTFDDLSGSVGFIYNPADAYAIALNVACTQRAPTYQELYADGPHIATNAFEIGNADLTPEKSFSIDLSARKNLGRVTGGISLYYNHFTDFIGQFANGEVVAGDEDDMPVYLYRATDAVLYGGELELAFHLIEPVTAVESLTGKDGKSVVVPARPPGRQMLDLVLKADYVHAEDTSANVPLPRIPPFRASAALNYSWDRFSAGIEGQYAARQNRTSDFELPTNACFLLGASVAYRRPIGATEIEIYVKGANLTNAEARYSTSFLKEIAPLGGRGVVCGMKLTF
jgi:iron complex outermembrane receptor protein